MKSVYKAPFDCTKVPELKGLYEIELGCFFVIHDNKYRGKGIAKAICSQLLEREKGENIFSTTEESDENSMKWILKKKGFVKTGITYIGVNTKKNIGFYLLD